MKRYVVPMTTTTKKRPDTTTTAAPVRAAVYLRISKDRDLDELGVTRQREDCLRIIRERGWTLVETYQDNDLSASKRKVKRPDYDRLVADYALGKFTALVCWELDRLTRQPRQLEDWIDAAEEHGLILVTANGEADLTTESGQLFARIKVSVAKSEVALKSKRQIRQAQQRAERGLPPTGKRLTGYDHDGTVIPDEAMMVGKVFERVNRGESLSGTATWLTEQGYATRGGKPWNPTTLRGLCMNPRYAGRAVYLGQVIDHEAKWKALVDGDVFDNVGIILGHSDRRTSTSTDRVHMGAGLYLCGVCDNGTTMRSHSGNRYRCRDGCFGRTGQPIDEVVTIAVEELIGDPEVMAAVVAGATTGHDEAAVLGDRAEVLRNRIKTTTAEWEDDQITTRQMNDKVAKAEEELREVERARARYLVGGPKKIAESVDPVATWHEDTTLLERRAIIDWLMTVTLHPGQRGCHTFDPAQAVTITLKH